MSLPDLGIGLVYFPGLEACSEQVAGSIDVFEVEPQTFWTHLPGRGVGAGAFRVNRAAFERLVELGRPVLVHSVGYPVGGSRDGDPRHIAALRETFALLKPAWWSEHASFLAAEDAQGRRHLGFLLPPEQSIASAARIAERICRLQDLFGIPFAFETGVSYLRPLPGELSDGEFWAEIAERADCGILLDLHNVWANARNGRQRLAALFDQLPLERVWEVHVANGQPHKGYWLDSHSGLPPPELLAEAAALVPRLPSLHALTLEIIADYVDARDITADEIARSLAALRGIWQLRGTACGARRIPAPARVGHEDRSAASMASWELALEAALAGRSAAGSPFAGDGGVEVYRDLVATARRGTLVETLPLSMRYLSRALGPDALQSVFERFWRVASSEPFMSDEARNFATFACSEIALPHLDELIGFELASHGAALTGRPQLVRFSCRPEPLIAALKSGAPLTFEWSEVEVEVTPPAPQEAG